MRTTVLALVLACLSSAYADHDHLLARGPPAGMESYCAPGCGPQQLASACSLECFNEACGYHNPSCTALYPVVADQGFIDAALGGKDYMNSTEYSTLNTDARPLGEVERFSLTYGSRGITEYEYRLMEFLLSDAPGRCAAKTAFFDTRNAMAFVMGSADKNMDFVLSPEEIDRRWPDMDPVIRDEITNSSGYILPTMIEEYFNMVSQTAEGILPEGTKAEDVAISNTILFMLMAPEKYPSTGKSLTLDMVAPLCYPRDVFDQLDVDKDGAIEAEESAAIVPFVLDGGCNGFVEIKGKSVHIDANIPSFRKQCSWLINPQWFYTPSDQDMRMRGMMTAPMQDTSAAMVRRRSLDEAGVASAEAKIASKPVPSRRLLSVLPNANVAAPAGSKRREANTAMPVPNNMYNFSVILTDAGAMGQGCMGSLVSPRHVVTSASCLAEMERSTYPVRVAKIGGIDSSDFSGGDGADVISVADVHMHPSYKIDHTHDIAVVALARSSSKEPIKMYDGGDAGFTDCRHMEIKTLSSAALSAPVLSEMSLRSVPQDDCALRHMWYYGVSKQLGSDLICLNGTTECDSTMSHGSPAFTMTPKDGPVLIGIKPAPMDCSTSFSDILPASFTRISQVLPWIKSAMDHATHPAEKLIATVKALSMPAGGNLTIYGGSSEHPQMVKEILDSKCQAGSVIDDDGRGSILITYTPGNLPVDTNCGPECLKEFRFEIEVEPMGCAENFEHQKGNASFAKEMCEEPGYHLHGDGASGGIRGCQYMPPMVHGEQGTCMQPKCTMSERWQALGPMEVAGKAFSGGLGHKMVKNASHEFGVWTCLRDWNATEQLLCGVRPNELGCFWFEENSREWAFQGVNHKTRLVENGKYTNGLNKEEDKSAKHILLPGRRADYLEYLML